LSAQGADDQGRDEFLREQAPIAAVGQGGERMVPPPVVRGGLTTKEPERPAPVLGTLEIRPASSGV
jgi:hypothetical protein